MSPKLYPGLLPFLILCGCEKNNRRAALCVHPLQNFSSIFRMRTHGQVDGESGHTLGAWPKKCMDLSLPSSTEGSMASYQEESFRWVDVVPIPYPQ
jgi:hypothetical protein